LLACWKTTGLPYFIYSLLRLELEHHVKGPLST
jgi:hypothetical protein